MVAPESAARAGTTSGRARAWLLYVVVALAGLAVAWAMADSLRKSENSRIQAQFEQVAQQDVLQVDAHVRAALDDLVALRAFMDVGGEVSRAQFSAFCDPLLQHNAAIRALEWIPRVPGDERAALEREAGADGAPGFRITARSDTGAMRTEDTRSAYFPVYYVDPLNGNRAALGFDLRSNPARRQALETAARSGSMVATSRVVLVQDPHGSYGFLVFYPVYEGARAGRKGALRGFVLGVFSIGSLLGNPEGDPQGGPARRLPGLHLAVFDESDAASGLPAQVLYPRGLRETPADILSSTVTYQRMIDVGGRQWRVLAYAAMPSSAGTDARIVFGVVLLVTLLVLVLMRQVERVRESETRRMVAQRADEAKSRFIAKVSHEVRTPLNGVVGMLELLQRSALQPAQRRMAEVSHRSAMSLLGIVNDLLDFAKIEAGRLHLVDEVLDLEAVLADITALYAGAAERGGCKLSMHIEADVPRRIRGDPGRLRQVLSNLVSNAVKFSSELPRRGEVHVHALRLADNGGEPRLCISVRDNGVGMDASTLARLFRPFEQAQGANAPRQTGTGLGLAISHELVAAMGGSIRAESRPGQGSRLAVTLPLRDASAAAAPAPAEQPRAHGAAPPAREPAPAAAGILVAEDNATNREVLMLQLRQLGVPADIAPDGREALRRWERHAYIAVLTDLHMPDLDGFALAREIRRQEQLRRLPRTPIIALTAAAHADELARALESGMDLHLTKPAGLDALRAALAAAGVEPSADAALPCLDPTRLHALVGDDPRVTRALLRQYADELEATLARLHEAARGGDAARLQELAHRLKSSSRTVGAEALARACEALEHDAREHDGTEPQPRRLDAHVEALQARAADTQRALATHLAAPPSQD